MTFPEAPVGALADVALGKMLQPSKRSEKDELRPYLRAAHVQPHGAVDWQVEHKEMWFSRAERDALSLRRGDVVVVEGGAGFGRAAHVGEDIEGWGFQNSIVRVRARSKSKGRFIAYALRSALASGAIEVATSTATIPHFTAEKVGRFRIPAPPLKEQRRIADYLDRETAEIDAMDAELDRLVETLRERQRVVIESVLDSSGHITKLGYFVAALPGFAFPARDFSRNRTDIRLLRGINVKPRRTDWSDTVYWPAPRLEGLERYKLRAGDVILGMDRPFVGGGTRVLMLSPSDLPCMLLQRVLRLRPVSDGSPEFIMLLLMTRAFEDYATPETTGISVPHISESQVLDFRVPVPSAAEQRKLAEGILIKLSELHAMVADANRLKGLLAERRSTLITEVVTGVKEVSA